MCLEVCPNSHTCDPCWIAHKSGRQEVALCKAARHLPATQMGKFSRRRPRVSLTLHNQRSHQGPSQKTDFFACHACHFRDFSGKNSQFRICKQARREEGRQVGDTVTLPSHFEGGLAQHASSTPKARDRKPITRARSFPRRPASRLKPPARVPASSLTHVRLFATQGLKPARLLYPWGCPGKSTGVGCHDLLQGIFPIPGLNLRLLCCRQIIYDWAPKKAPESISLYTILTPFKASGIQGFHSVIP